ncbi:MAG: NAD-dependent epimerase/dehydratase family protein [Luteitalea sp.]|nr:NAD-dependent epimerase/dehydratase family protein [Luteitalea sp.]
MTDKNAQRVLVTGGAGFIGSHLCESLIADGATVTVVDDLSTGRWGNIAHLQESRRLKVIVATAADQTLMFDAVAQSDLVYHLASAVGVHLIIDRPVATVETIFHTTDAVLKACARFRKPVLLTSTSEVFGKSDAIPFREDDDVVMGATEKRRWAYACAKALDEFLALAHYHESALPVFIVRLFNTVGVRQSGRYGMVLPRFVRQALSGGPITVFGDGAQRRCFCSVHDVVRALRALPFAAEAVGKVVNIGSQEEVSITQLALRVKRLTASSSTIEYVPYEEAYGPGFDDMRRRVPDLSRVSSYIGWQPEEALDSIISALILDMATSEAGRSITSA